MRFSSVSFKILCDSPAKLFCFQQRSKSHKMDINKLDNDKFKTFIDSIDNILFDCDGVLFLGGNSIPGTDKVPETLINRKKTVKYISNNCTRTMVEWKNVFDKHNIHYKEGDLINPSVAVISYLRQQKFNKKLFVIGCGALRKELEAAGYNLAEKFVDQVDENLASLANILKDDLDIGAVVVDLDININYITILLASIYLSRPDVLFLNCSTDSIIPIGGKTKIIGPKYFQMAIEEHSSRKGLVFGKPGESLKKYLTDSLKLLPERTLFVGDTIDQDMQFASLCGYKKLLVLTGIAKREHLIDIADENSKPDYYVNSLADFQLLLNRL